MATRNIVPRGNGEGQLGTAEKHWAKLFADAIHEGANLGNNASLGYRQPSTAYTAGQIAYHASLPTGYYLECTTEGTTSAGEITPSSTIFDTLTDGTVTWTIKGVADFSTKQGFLDDADTAWNPGLYIVRNTTQNIPYPAWGLLSTYANKSETFKYTFQIAMLGYQINVNSLFYMRHNAGADAWSDWQQIDTIVAKSLGANGYIKYASGLIVQWGDTGSVSNVTGVGLCMNVSFPIAFSTNTPQVVVATRNTAAQVGTDNGFGATILTDTLNANGFKAKKFNIKTGAVNYDGSMAWCAFGY